MWYKLSKPDGKCRHQFPGYLVYQRLSCVLFDRLTGFLPSNRFYCRPNVHPNRSLRVLYLILGRLSFYCFILYLSFPTNYITLTSLRHTVVRIMCLKDRTTNFIGPIWSFNLIESFDRFLRQLTLEGLLSSSPTHTLLHQ